MLLLLQAGRLHPFCWSACAWALRALRLVPPGALQPSLLQPGRLRMLHLVQEQPGTLYLLVPVPLMGALWQLLLLRLRQFCQPWHFGQEYDVAKDGVACSTTEDIHACDKAAGAASGLCVI